MKMLLLAVVALSLNACSSGPKKHQVSGKGVDDSVVTPTGADAHEDLDDSFEGMPANPTPVPPDTSSSQTPTPAPTPTDTTTTPTVNCDLSDPQSMMGMSKEDLMECLKQQAGGGGGLPPGFPTP